jgi:hypothetical protein
LLKAVAARANLADANLADANLAGADLAGADLADANLADANLAGADLAGADLAGADLAGADLADANLAGASLAGAYLAGASLAGAYLARAYLAGADLADAENLSPTVEKKDPPEPYRRIVGKDARLESARRYRERHPEVPVVQNLDSKMLAAIEAKEIVLNMRGWHGQSAECALKEPCGTTHCRAGSAIHLAGAAGYALEEQYDAQTAGRMIYRASTGRSPHFFASDERAMEDIRRCAAEEKEEAERA